MITGPGVVITGSEVTAGFVLIISGEIIAWKVLRVVLLISKEGFGISSLFALIRGNRQLELINKLAEICRRI